MIPFCGRAELAWQTAEEFEAIRGVNRSLVAECVIGTPLTNSITTYDRPGPLPRPQFRLRETKAVRILHPVGKDGVGLPRSCPRPVPQAMFG
jgi:hypothetical protein